MDRKVSHTKKKWHNSPPLMGCGSTLSSTESILIHDTTISGHFSQPLSSTFPFLQNFLWFALAHHVVANSFSTLTISTTHNGATCIAQSQPCSPNFTLLDSSLINGCYCDDIDDAFDFFATDNENETDDCLTLLVPHSQPELTIKIDSAQNLPSNPLHRPYSPWTHVLHLYTRFAQFHQSTTPLYCTSSPLFNDSRKTTSLPLYVHYIQQQIHNRYRALQYFLRFQHQYAPLVHLLNCRLASYLSQHRVDHHRSGTLDFQKSIPEALTSSPGWAMCDSFLPRTLRHKDH